MRFFLCICFGLVLLVQQAGADTHGEKQKLIIGSFSFPPLLHLAEDGSFSGQLGETVKHICMKAALACEFKVVPLKRAYNELVQGSVDALVTLDLDQFNECCLESTWRSPWSAGLFSNDLSMTLPETKDQILGKSLIVVNGMRSPYSFLPDMDNLASEGRLRVYKAKDIPSSVRMFHRKRAPLMWGGEDFKWHLKKIAPLMKYQYKALFKKDVVLWVRREKEGLLSLYNNAHDQLLKQGVIAENGTLVPAVMRKTYKEPKG